MTHMNCASNCAACGPSTIEQADLQVGCCATHASNACCGCLPSQKHANDKVARFLQQSLENSHAPPQQRARKATWQPNMRSSWATAALGVAGGGSNAAGRLQQLAAQAAGGGGGVQGVGWVGRGAGTAGISSPGLWGFDVDSHMTASGLQAGQRHTPARIGSVPQGLVSLAGDSIGQQPAAGAADACGTAAGAGAGGLEGQRVVGCAASRYYSVVVTDKGEVSKA